MSKSNKGSLIAIVVLILLVLWAVVAGISFNNKAWRISISAVLT